MSKGLYIHIPFCKYICSYCDFGKKYINNQPVDEYIAALCSEIDMYTPFTDVNTIYIGGGTPSSLNSEQLVTLLDKVNSVIDLTNIVEFSFELNPDDITVELMEQLKQKGVTRLSIGAQTLNDNILSRLNRKHTAKQVIDGVALATTYFDNVSVDFIFNLPGQTKEDIKTTIDFIRKSNLNHISYYGLILEENTVIYNADEQLWTEDYESEMYSYIQHELEKLGLYSYEISNYCKSGYQSVHNCHYWTRDQYYGVGLSSSGQLDNYRYTNTYSLKQYINHIQKHELPIKEREILTAADEVFEKIMLGLRYYKFVAVTEELITYIKSREWLEDKFDIDNDSIRLKTEYYYISNQIILELIERIEC